MEMLRQAKLVILLGKPVFLANAIKIKILKKIQRFAHLKENLPICNVKQMNRLISHHSFNLKKHTKDRIELSYAKNCLKKL